MKQLSGVDANFLYMETPTSFGHVSGLSIFERPDIAGWSPYEAFRRQLELRLPLLEPLRRRARRGAPAARSPVLDRGP